MAEKTVAMTEVKSAGFFNQNLRFLNDVDNAQISYMKGEQLVELRTAPDCMKPVIRNIEAVLTFVQPLTSSHGLFMMEQILNDFPDNINTLANLIEIKKTFNMNTKAHEEKLEQMHSKDGNTLEQARCLLEIGYVLLSDLHTEVQKSMDDKLRDILKQLEFQRMSTTERRQRESFEQAFQHLTEAKNKIEHILPETCFHGTKREQNRAIEYFEDGLALLKPSTEAGIWKHQLARAHSRIGTGDKNISTTTEKKKHMRCALQYFLECITEISREREIDDPLKIYVARSYAYVGHLIATRRKEIKGKQEPIPSFIEQNQHFHGLWENPMEAFSRAHTTFGRDRVVHSRNGLTLKDKRFSAETKNADHGRNIDQAIKHLNISLEIEKMHNWFAYSQLLQAYLEKYEDQKRKFLNAPKGSRQELPKKSYLDEAIQNGERSLQQRVTSKTLLGITEAYYLKGVQPEKGKDGLDIVVDPSFITAAQDYIQRALDDHDCKEHERVKILLGKCLFYLGDKKAGIEGLLNVLTKKRNTITEPHYFRELMIMMLKDFREWKDDRRNDIKSRQQRQKLRKLWCVLATGKKTYNKRFNHPLIGILNLYPHEFIFMLFEVYSFKRRNKQDQELVEQCLQALRKHHAKDVKRRLQDLESIQPKEPDDVVDNQGQEAAQAYDYCICYSKEDVVWTKTFIEDRQRIGKVKSCLKAEHLEYGERTKFLFIISESFNNDADCKSMLSLVKGKYETSNRLIPVLTHNATSLPLLLEDVVPVDCTGLRNSNEALMAALLQPVNDMNAPGAAATPTPMVDVTEVQYVRPAENDPEDMDVDEPLAAKRMKKDVLNEHVRCEGTSWADKVQANSEVATNETEIETELDSGFNSHDC